MANEQQQAQVDMGQMIGELVNRVRILESKQSLFAEKMLIMNENMLEEYKKSMVALNKAFVQPMFDIGKDKAATPTNGSIVPDLGAVPSLQAPDGNLDPAMYGGDQRSPISAGGSLMDPITKIPPSKATKANPTGNSSSEILNSLNPIEETLALLASLGGI